MTVDANGFRKVMGLRAAGATMAAARDRHREPRGFTVTAICPVSLAPPLRLVCIDRKAECSEAFQEVEAVAVNLLRDDQGPLTRRFAQKEPQKFQGILRRSGIAGSPILNDALVHVECRTQARYPGGGHAEPSKALTGSHPLFPPLQSTLILDKLAGSGG